jgi:soluble lytic murein transglycosylase
MLDRLLKTYAQDPLAIDAALARARIVAADSGKAAAGAWLQQRAPRVRAKGLQVRLLHAAAVYLWNSDDIAAAEALFARVIAYAPSSSEAQQSRYALGRIAESQGRYAAAAGSYRAATAGPGAEITRESRWRQGWSAYLAADYPLAAERFGDAVRKANDDSAREQALYWQARALQRCADDTGAEKLYRDVIALFPDGFYALLAEQRLGSSAPKPEIVALPAGEHESHPGVSLALERARTLEAAGLHDFATAELRTVDTASDASAARALLPQLVAMGAPDQALRTALGLFRTGALREQELYPYLYPHPFVDIVSKEATARGVEAPLVYSLMRQESLFDRYAVSPASAYGLMQLLLSTARRVAAAEPDLGAIGVQDLFDPEINIRLGTAYLAELSQRFSGDSVLMLAGYNAGEQAAERWKTKLAGLERDEFIEQISYRETRDYVKKVLRNQRNYRRLYGDEAAPVSESVE